MWYSGFGTEERFELKKDEIEPVKQTLMHIFEDESSIVFAYLHGSFSVFPFRDTDKRWKPWAIYAIIFWPG